jgi:hypothetical protein
MASLPRLLHILQAKQPSYVRVLSENMR